MTWTLSRYRAGEFVEVRAPEDILATLDERGCLDGMPFMPEMLRYCGRRFRVGAVAHKTCDTVRKTGGRRLAATVHLADLRCDGSFHGDCQAACYLFWKDAWLRPVSDDGQPHQDSHKPDQVANACDEALLLAITVSNADAAAAEPCYSCQATRLYDATEPLAPWDVRQYVFDVVTGNHSLGRVLRVTWLASLRCLLARFKRGYRIRMWFNEWMHTMLTGRGSPSVCGKVKPSGPTPTGRLDLKPGEFVRIKSKSQIEETIDERGHNRGLSFDPEEMAPYCGGVYRVRSSVTKIIDELTGKMRHMKQPCIMLEGVVCNAEYARCRLNCPRAIPAYWREIWLERVCEERPASEAANATALSART